ncbi:GNAT family N-acetyltransferase [Metabacillus halosaccharovorans]|uniref:GNAT family N-acetyltransferase n=1 Tax=Metabacillus halosaccharovorans TaxID=930124 RepID=UPI0037356C78
MFYQLKIAERQDIERLTMFVEKAGISSEGIADLIDYFVLMENGEKEIVACIGVEPVKNAGLLRSLVVSDKLKQAHIVTLFQSIQTLAEKRGITNLFLVTNKEASVQFLSLMGFQKLKPDLVPSDMLTIDHMKDSLEDPNAEVMIKSS